MLLLRSKAMYPKRFFNCEAVGQIAVLQPLKQKEVTQPQSMALAEASGSVWVSAAPALLKLCNCVLKLRNAFGTCKGAESH